MKFKINKIQTNLILDSFSKSDHDFKEIELEAVLETATQAIYETHLKNKAFQDGLEYGYKEGFYDGRCREKSPKYCLCNCRC